MADRIRVTSDITRESTGWERGMQRGADRVGRARWVKLRDLDSNEFVRGGPRSKSLRRLLHVPLPLARFNRQLASPPALLRALTRPGSPADERYLTQTTHFGMIELNLQHKESLMAEFSRPPTYL